MPPPKKRKTSSPSSSPALPPSKPKKREVQVVVCPDIPPPSRIRPDGTKVRPRPRPVEGEEERKIVDLDFEDIRKSVIELGASQFTGRDKKLYEARRIVELGGRAPKNQKVPYNILMGMRRKAKERERKMEQQVKESGLVVAKKRQLPNVLTGGGMKKKARVTEESRNPFQLGGKYKNGMLYLDRNKMSMGGGSSSSGGGGHRKGGGRRRG